MRTVLRSAEHPIARIRTQLVSVAVEYAAAQGAPSLLLRAAVKLSAGDQDVAISLLGVFDSIRAGYKECIVDAQAAVGWRRSEPTFVQPLRKWVRQGASGSRERLSCKWGSRAAQPRRSLRSAKGTSGPRTASGIERRNAAG